MDERRTPRGYRNHCPHCRGSMDFPKALESHAEILLGDTGFAVKRTIYQGEIVKRMQGTFVKIHSHQVEVKKVEGKWVAVWPASEAAKEFLHNKDAAYSINCPPTPPVAIQPTPQDIAAWELERQNQEY